jgi:hypothetical protein
MYTRGRTLKFVAVLTLVVLTLTGFSTGRGGGSKGGKSRSGSSSRHSSGGGCSSSKQDHDSSRGSGTYRTRHRSTPTASSTGGSGGTVLQDADVTLVNCATPAKPYSTVKVTNPNSGRTTFFVRVIFVDASDGWLGSDAQKVTVAARGTTKARVKVADTALVKRADHCEVEPLADAVN